VIAAAGVVSYIIVGRGVQVDAFATASTFSQIVVASIASYDVVVGRALQKDGMIRIFERNVVNYAIVRRRIQTDTITAVPNCVAFDSTISYTLQVDSVVTRSTVLDQAVLDDEVSSRVLDLDAVSTRGVNRPVLNYVGITCCAIASTVDAVCRCELAVASDGDYRMRG
jgi:hypothetical protein